MTSAKGRPKGTYSPVGAAARRLSVGGAFEIELPDLKERNKISSLLYALIKSDGMRFATRVNRESNLFIISRLQ